MSKPHCSQISIPMLLVLAIGITLTITVKGEICQDGLGLCGEDCQQRCQQKHAGGQGSCDYPLSLPLCTCYYTCGQDPPPRPRRCNDNNGVCSAKECWNDCCNSKCIDKYAGKQAVGTCQEAVGTAYNLCLCEFNC
ncbi:hypothetical protein Nepgr_033174 [Nepenthes gracilis]|uniref:Defensin-like protein n=1 Tax=Nepenthes gracilis TaxID=150966 RepID=A0AAD3TLI8_NEPGR|nr:hypothetical protein Nepgr_033174 [Nepenthes gracilis]